MTLDFGNIRANRTNNSESRTCATKLKLDKPASNGERSNSRVQRNGISSEAHAHASNRIGTILKLLRIRQQNTNNQRRYFRRKNCRQSGGKNIFVYFALRTTCQSIVKSLRTKDGSARRTEVEKRR